MHRWFLLKEHYFTFALLFVPLAGNAEYKVIGNAYDRESGQYLYSEYHSCTGGDLECLVEYRDSSGELIASKKLNYAVGLTQPDMIMKNYRTGLESSIASQYRDGLVVDAGFDNFVRGQWDVLASGDNVKFLFLVAGFDDPLKMRANLDRSGSCNAEELCLEISLDSWFLGLLADPIDLVYSRDNRRLLRYQGLSNIRGENSESLNVDIHYDYAQPASFMGSPAQQQNPIYSF